MSSEPVGIQVESVSKNFGDVRALDSLSLKFEAGLMHGLIGPDGAGKTTLMRCLISLLEPDRGKIQYTLGEKHTSYLELKDAVAYMPQTQSLYADLSIEEHLNFFKDLYDISEQDFQSRCERLLKITRLDKFVTRPAGKLSGGMYKKLGLMCSLLRAPRVLLLDEPTNGVDPISRREFWDLLYTLSDEKVLIIVATSYMDEAERCKMVHLVDDGKFLHAGKPRDVLREVKAKNFDEVFIRSAKEKRVSYV